MRSFPPGPPPRPAAASRRARLAAALALAALCALPACSWVRSVNPFGGSSAAEEPRRAAACPGAVILKPLSNTAVFAPGGQPRPVDVMFYGILSEVTVTCQSGPEAIRVSLDVIVAAERGPAARGDDTELTYFVAVTGPDQSILSKKPFAVHINIPRASQRAGVTDHIEETVALGGRSPGDLGIVLGFQQGPDVVEFYKRFRGR